MQFIQKLMFSDLTEMLERCSNATDAQKRSKIVQKYFEKIFQLQKKFKSEHPNDDSSIYKLMRIILATEENERSYGIQEKTIRSLLITTVATKGSANAKKIEQCNDNAIAESVYQIIKSDKEGKLSIADVDEALNNLSDNQMKKDQMNQFAMLYQKGSALDFKWIIKIILKAMKLKISAEKILYNIHPLAPKLYNKYNHLSKVCDFIESGEAESALKDVIRPFVPIRSMLSEKFTSKKDASKLLMNEVYQEVKMDGDRFQIHMENGTYKYFSRNAHEFSEGFNEMITPLIKFKCVVHDIILDGEMLIWNTSQRRFITKGETELDVKKMNISHLNEKNLRPCFCAFDILYLNGTSFIGEPFSKRFQILEQLYDDQIGVMIKTKPIKVRDVDHLVELLNHALKNEEEGIILKKGISTYQPGERNGGWYKLKADYMEGEVVKEYDCIITGGTFQNSFTRNFIENYFLGVVDKQSDESYKVYTIGEVTHGISVINRNKLHDRLMLFSSKYNGSSEIPFDKGTVYFGKKKPDVVFPPSKSIVLQIRAAELASTFDFCREFTFRFPRITDIRFDKFWDESCTLEEFLETSQDNGNNNEKRVRKINQRSVNADDFTSPSRKKRKVLSSVSNAISEFCQNSQEDVDPIDLILEGKEFCVLSTLPNLISTHDMKILLKLHGASITEFPRKGKTFAIVAGEVTYRIKKYMSENIYNVIKAEWVAENLERDVILCDLPHFAPNDFHSFNDEMKESFKGQYDQYGDSYTQWIENEDELIKIVNKMDVKKEQVTDEQIMEFEQEFYEKIGNPNIFRGLSGIFIMDAKNYLMRSAKLVFEYRGGRVIADSGEKNEKTLIFVDKNDKIDAEILNKNQGKVLHFRWILDSSDNVKVLNMNKYAI